MKNYLKEILKIRKDFPKKENKLIEKAYKFAERKHKGQKFDGSSYPYFIHPAYAGVLLARWGRNYEEICAGLLHDVVEDCNVKLPTIKKIFGPRVAFLVDGMSWEIKWNKETKSWFKDRVGFYKKIMDYSQKDIGVVIIHASDELSKISDILGRKIVKKDESFEKSKKRYTWIATILVPFYKEIGLNNVSKRLWWKIEDYFEEKPKSDLNSYISKSNLKKIKNKLDKIARIDELR